MSISRKIIRNTWAIAVARTFDVLILIIVTPIIFRYLGAVQYGLWSIIFILGGYISFVDLGVSQAYIKFIAEYHAKGDSASINKVLNTGFFFYFFLGVILISITYINLNPIIFGLFKIPDEYGTIAASSILLAFITMCVYYIFSSFCALIDGMQRMDLSRNITMVMRVINFAGVLIVVKNNWGIFGLTVNASIRMFLEIMIRFFVGKSLFPGMKISMFLIDSHIFKKLFNYGYNLQIVLIAAFGLSGFIPMILSNMLGLVYVSYYALASRIVEATRMIPGFLLSAIIPAISELDALDRKGDIGKIYNNGLKYLSFLTFFIAFGTAVVIPYLFYFWLGMQKAELDYAFFILAGAGAINMVLTGMGTSTWRGVGKIKYETQYTLLSLIITIPATIVLAKYFGFLGALSGILAASIISSTYFYLKFNKLNGISSSLIFRKIFSPPFLIGGIIFILLKAAQSNFLLNNITKITSFSYFVFFGFMFSLIYFISLVVLRYFNNNEILFIKDKFKEMLNRSNG